VSVLINRGDGRLQHVGTYPSGPRATAIAAGDVDHDGTVDLVTAHDSRPQLAVLIGMRGNRPHFERPSAASASLPDATSGFRDPFGRANGRATDVALGDVNGDDRLDVALATSPRGGAAVALRMGRGDGSFGPARAYDAGRYPAGIALADLNHDDALDIATADPNADAINVFIGTGDGRLGAARTYAMSRYVGVDVDAVHVGDFDRDGDLDLAAYVLEGLSVRRGRGDGSFRAAHVSLDGPASVYGGTMADFKGMGGPTSRAAATTSASPGATCT
jgi:hypothetical protein